MKQEELPGQSFATSLVWTEINSEKGSLSLIPYYLLEGIHGQDSSREIGQEYFVCYNREEAN